MEFQFHKGTIETSENDAQRGEDVQFQFHKGTIETYMPHVAKSGL